jgi:heme/copper-type cytochrome/quinol oxidase subunit 3
MSTRVSLDLSRLPTYAFGHRSPLWWGTLGFIAVESTVFVLAVLSYFYLRDRVPIWPPEPPPELLWGTLNLALQALSVIPNQWTKRMAEQERLGPVRIGLVAACLFGLALIAVRWFEFTALNCRWDGQAYGSITWTLLGLHTLHLVTDVGDTLVLTALAFFHRFENKRFVDVSENSFYWNFVVLSWLPVYLVIYLAPRYL